jgi:tRNA(Ile)-lysidine synthase
LAAGEALTLAELDAALTAIGGFEPAPLLAVGVSGGPDSLALVILADRWARQRGGVAWALIVDHRLRPESAVEARSVAGWLAARGIPHAVLVWREDKPATGIQAAARAARYRLLAEWCAERGCLHLLTAHHRDDQAETYLIRRRAKSAADGLAGMSAVREMPGVRLVRPLLAAPKARLVAFLHAEGQDYLQDPSNRNPAFERSRVRMDSEREGVEATVAKVREHARGRIARERKLAALLARAVTLHPAGFAVIDPVPIAAAGELGERALGRVVMVLGGPAYPVRRKRLRRLREGLAEAPNRARTLGGCRFVPWRGWLLALREAARAAPPVTLAPGRTSLWDRRFLATLLSAAKRPVGLGALGADGVAAVGSAPAGDDNPLPRLIYPVLPALWDKAGLAAVPHLGWRRTTPECAAVLAFRPPVSLFGAGFTVV